MVNSKSTMQLRCSEKVHNIINGDCKEKFLKHNPEYEGAAITTNQILTFLLKFVYKEEWHEFNESGFKSNNKQ